MSGRRLLLLFRSKTSAFLCISCCYLLVTSLLDRRGSKEAEALGALNNRRLYDPEDTTSARAVVPGAPLDTSTETRLELDLRRKLESVRFCHVRLLECRQTSATGTVV